MADSPAEPDARSTVRARRIRAAVASSVLSKVGSVAYLILAVPVIIASVGSDGYSQYAVILASFGWLGPIFVGLGSAVTERIASDGSRPISRRTRGTFMTALSTSGGLLCALILGGGIVFVSSGPRALDSPAFAMAGLATALGVAGGIFDSALLGIQRSFVTNFLSFASSIAAVVATLAAALLAPTAGAMVLAALGPVVIARIVSAVVLRHVEPGLFGRVGDIVWREAPRIAGRGLVFAGISFAAFLSLDAGLIVVAAIVGSTQVADVALMVRTIPLVLSVVGMVLVPLWPALAEAAGEGDLRWILRAGGRAAGFVMAYSVVACVGIIVAGERLIGIWTGGRITVPSEILIATGVLIVVSSLENVTQTMLFGLGRAGTVAAVLLVRSGLSLLLVALLTAPLGQTAALAGPILSALVTSFWLLPWLVLHAIRAIGGSPRVPEVGRPDRS